MYLDQQHLEEIIINARSKKIDLVEMEFVIRDLLNNVRIDDGRHTVTVEHLFYKIMVLNVGKTCTYAPILGKIFKEEIKYLKKPLNLGFKFSTFMSNVHPLSELEMSNELADEIMILVLTKGFLRLDGYTMEDLRPFNPLVIAFAKL